METNKRQHFISLFILSLLLSCSGEKKDSAQTETVSNKAIVRIETVSAQDVEQISEFTATVEANISNNIAPQNPVRIEKLFAEVGDHVRGKSKGGTKVACFFSCPYPPMQQANIKVVIYRLIIPFTFYSRKCTLFPLNYEISERNDKRKY